MIACSLSGFDSKNRLIIEAGVEEQQSAICHVGKKREMKWCRISWLAPEERERKGGGTGERKEEKGGGGCVSVLIR